MRDRVESLVGQVIGTLGSQGVDLAPPELALPTLQREPTRRPDAEDDPTARGLAGAVGSYGTAAALAFGAERLLMPMGMLVGIGGLGLGAALGVVGIALRRRSMARVREQRAAQRLAARTLTEARQHIYRSFVTHLVEAQHDLETVVADLLAQRRRDLEAAVADGRAALRRSETERDRRLRSLDDRIATLDSLRADAAALHEALTSARPAASPS